VRQMYPNYYQPPYQQPVQYQPARMQPGENNLIRVTGLDGAKAYPMKQPYSTVALFDGEKDIMYIKSTDGAGFPTIQMFKFEPIENTPAAAPEYISRNEFEKFKTEVNENVQQLIQEYTPGKYKPGNNKSNKSGNE